MVDAAYTVLARTKRPTKNPGTLVIGLSLHAWKGQEQAVIKLIRRTLEAISATHALKIVLIPHHILPSADGPDLAYMQKILMPLSNKITVTQPNTDSLSAMKSKTIQHIKQCTTEVDLLITSRYHGIIFACSADVPIVSLNYDEYYSIKNIGALEMFYGKDFAQYCVSLTSSNAGTDLLNKTQSILKNLHKEKKILQIRNDKMKRAQKFFNTFLIE